MPTVNNFINFIYVNLGFVALISAMTYFRSALEIKQNWALYRCNPPYWFFSDNIADDFNYCIQNTQINMMGDLLQPINFLISSLSFIGTIFSEAINSIRKVFSFIRDFITSIIENIFGVFLNSIVSFQKMTISIKDMVSKMIAVVVTIMYMLDGSIKTMKSAWAGPPGQIVKAIGSIGSCFHPETKVKLKDGTIFYMKDLPLGAELENGSKIFSVMKIANMNNDPLYKINGGIDGEYIYVTGEHFIYDKKDYKWKQVKNHQNAVLQDTIDSDWFSCLITTNRQIKIGDQIFWDWEDDELLEKV
jgi:hypothetical protein